MSFVFITVFLLVAGIAQRLVCQLAMLEMPVQFRLPAQNFEKSLKKSLAVTYIIYVDCQ